jgi:hypothetical protein
MMWPSGSNLAVGGLMDGCNDIIAEQEYAIFYKPHYKGRRGLTRPNKGGDQSGSNQVDRVSAWEDIN